VNEPEQFPVSMDFDEFLEQEDAFYDIGSTGENE